MRRVPLMPSKKRTWIALVSLPVLLMVVAGCQERDDAKLGMPAVPHAGRPSLAGLPMIDGIAMAQRRIGSGQARTLAGHSPGFSTAHRIITTRAASCGLGPRRSFL
jgi:hypothetical protein